MAGRGERPNPPDHFVTTRVQHEPLIPKPTEITVVDDFITRGSTFVGMYPHLREAYPAATIRFLSLVRTRSGEDIDALIAPFLGTIIYEHKLHREP